MGIRKEKFGVAGIGEQPEQLTGWSCGVEGRCLGRTVKLQESLDLSLHVGTKVLVSLVNLWECNRGWGEGARDLARSMSRGEGPQRQVGKRPRR